MSICCTNTPLHALRRQRVDRHSLVVPQLVWHTKRRRHGRRCRQRQQLCLRSSHIHGHRQVRAALVFVWCCFTILFLVFCTTVFLLFSQHIQPNIGFRLVEFVRSIPTTRSGGRRVSTVRWTSFLCFRLKTSGHCSHVFVCFVWHRRSASGSPECLSANIYIGVERVTQSPFFRYHDGITLKSSLPLLQLFTAQLSEIYRDSNWNNEKLLLQWKFSHCSYVFIRSVWQLFELQNNTKTAHNAPYNGVVLHVALVVQAQAPYASAQT